MAEMNTKAMAIHVLAFGLYVISEITFSVFIMLTIIYPSNECIYNAYVYSLIPYSITATIAQVILCVIFWQFGGKIQA